MANAAVLESALMNVGFLSLVEDPRWGSLGDVIGAFEQVITSNRDLPLLSGGQLEVSTELVLLAGRVQASHHAEAVSQGSEQAQNLSFATESLDKALLNIGSAAQDPEPAPAPTPEPEPVTDSARMTWQAPLTRVNGESLAMGEIDKYVVRYGTEESVEEMSYEVIVDDGQTMEYEVAGLGEGTWYFAIRTEDTSGLQSAWSESVSKTISR
jgi:hypothetical protein